MSWGGNERCGRVTPSTDARASLTHPACLPARLQVSHLSAHRQELLRREYMTPTGGAPAQPPHGFKGQLHACWTHRLSDADARAIVQGEGDGVGS